MQTGDWVQSIIGGVGILATLAVAWMVYRLERRDRVVDRSETQREAAEKEEAARQQEAARLEAAKQQEEARAKAEADRERRALRREQHRDDYRAATQALNHLADVFEKAKVGFLTEAEVEAAGVNEAVEVLQSIGRRVPSLSLPHEIVRTYAGTLDTYGAPEPWQYAAALRHEEPDQVGKALARLVRDAVANGREQHDGALQGLKAVERARKAIAAEWGA